MLNGILFDITISKSLKSCRTFGTSSRDSFINFTFFFYILGELYFGRLCKILGELSLADLTFGRVVIWASCILGDFVQFGRVVIWATLHNLGDLYFGRVVLHSIRSVSVRMYHVVIQGFLDQLQKNYSDTLSYQYSKKKIFRFMTLFVWSWKIIEICSKISQKHDSHISSKHKNTCQGYPNERITGFEFTRWVLNKIVKK